MDGRWKPASWRHLARRWHERSRIAVIVIAVLGLAAAVSAVGAVAASSRREPRSAVAADTGARPAPQLQVRGNKLVTAQGRPVILHGVDRSGTEYMCVNGYGIFDGPSDQASISAMVSWHINAVRIPLNEACWDGSSYVNPAYSGLTYQRAIEAYVRLLNANGIVAILDLHWSNGYYHGPLPSCSSPQAICEKPMPDLGAVGFWRSVATAFRGNDSVIFDLFNEPYPSGANGSDNSASWLCWLDGGTYCHGLSYPAAGMQSLVNAVRSTGATNVLMLAGLAWANDLRQWLAHEPYDPRHDLAASWHSYGFNECNTVACWNAQVAPLAQHVPVIASEMGESDCSDGYIDRLMSWMDAHQSSYLAFTWDDWQGGCGGYPALITGYSGEPTRYGTGYRAHLRVAAQPG